MNKLNDKSIFNTAINFVLIISCLALLSIAITLFVNKDFRWGLIGHFYHKVLFRQKEQIVESNTAYVTDEETGKCGCPYCCSVAQN